MGQMITLAAEGGFRERGSHHEASARLARQQTNDFFRQQIG